MISPRFQRLATNAQLERHFGLWAGSGLRGPPRALVQVVLSLVSLRRVPLVASFSSRVRKEERTDFIWPSLEGTCYLVC